jgi:hypothetical protein
MFNRIAHHFPLFEPCDDEFDVFCEICERLAEDLAADSDAVERGDMSIDEFDEKW